MVCSIHHTPRDRKSRAWPLVAGALALWVAASFGLAGVARAEDAGPGPDARGIDAGPVPVPDATSPHPPASGSDASSDADAVAPADTTPLSDTAPELDGGARADARAMAGPDAAPLATPDTDATSAPDGDALTTPEADATPDGLTTLDATPDGLTTLDAAPEPDAHPAASTTPTLSQPPPGAHGQPPVPVQPISTGDAIKAILGLVILLTLAYLAGHPLIIKLEQRLRISQVMTAGFPFVVFGLVAHLDGVDILSDRILDQIRPLLPLGLGWIGFTIGFRFDLRRLENIPEGMGSALVLTTLLPFAAIVGTTSVLFGLTTGLDGTTFLRDAILLATAGAMTARTVPGLLSSRGAEPVVVDRVSRIIQLEEIVAFVGLILVAAFFRPHETDVGWHLPSVGWIFVTIGIGTTLGGLVFALMRTIKGTTETLVVTLGSICFAAGMASYLRLSPIVVCFLAGALLTNLPGPWKDQVSSALARLERPIYLVFLVIAGALWRVDQWQSWVLMLVFVSSRLLTRFLGVRIFTGQHPDALTPVEQRNLAASPMGALSIAIVINAQDLYSGATLPWIVNAIIGGAILTEIAVQVFALGKDVRALSPIAPLRVRATTTSMRATSPPPAPPEPPTPPSPPEEPTP